MAATEIPTTDRSTSRRFALRLLMVLLLPTVVLAIVGFQVHYAMDEFIAQNERVAHTLEVKQAIVATVATVRDAEAAQRAHVITSGSARLADFYGALPRLAEQLDRLQELVSDNAEQSVAATKLGAVVARRRDNMSTLLETFQKSGIDGFRAAPLLASSREEDQTIDAVAAAMLAREDRLLHERQAIGIHSANMTVFLTLSAIFLSFIMMAIALILVVREQRRRILGEAGVRHANSQLAQTLSASRELSQTLRQLSGLGELLQGCHNLDEAVVGLQMAMPRLLPGSSGSLNLINASVNLVEPLARWGATAEGAHEIFAPDDCWALRRGHAYPQDDAVMALPCTHLHIGPDQVHQHLCVPLLAQGEMLGTLLLTSPGGIDPSFRATATAAVEHIAMAIANLQLQQTLRTQSLRDPLTGLFNRRYLEASLDRELARAKRHTQALSVLMLDIDHFKRFNDEHGHDAGDALLTQFGALLARVVRSEDVACRYGGEEFTILLQEADASVAARRADEICAAVRELGVEHRRQSIGAVSVSIGVACFPADGVDAESLMRVADRALYAAKRAGRDRFVMAGGTGAVAHQSGSDASRFKTLMGV